MVGLEKVTGRIIAEAEAEAARVIGAAEAKCKALDAETEEKIRRLNAAVDEEVNNEGENIASRAKSTASMQKRNILLAAKGEALDAAFAAAEQRVCEMPRERYIAFIVAAARDAVSQMPEGSRCVLTFNKRDRAQIGADTAARLKEAFPACEFTVSDECAAINGGVLLDFGDTDADCSVRVIMSQLRPGLEGRVCGILFPKTEG